MSKIVTTETFIARAKEKHNNKYDYSLVVYINARSKVTIICPFHCKFEQTPDQHSRGRGCPECAIESRNKSKLLGRCEFIKRANKKHDFRYNYDKTVYIDGKTEVIITCLVHGDFFQTPFNHLGGCGCQKCGRENILLANRSNTTEFIKKAIKIHGDKFDYSKVEYVKANEKVLIVCDKHGYFHQRPNDHLRSKYGCPICGLKSIGDGLRLTIEEIINRANKIHDYKYEYHFTNYSSNRQKIEIICPKHGPWFQAVDNHLAGYGCPQCAHSFPYTTQTFIEKSRIVHGDEYGYDSVYYSNILSKIDILCFKHGLFNQTARDHLSGRGCPICGKNISRKEKMWLDSLCIPNEYRNYVINIGNKWVKVDGYDPNTLTVYEFYGDFWHGNPRIYNSVYINNVNKKSFRQLYETTLIRENRLLSAGYNLIYIWECDWNKKLPYTIKYSREREDICLLRA